MKSVVPSMTVVLLLSSTALADAAGQAAFNPTLSPYIWQSHGSPFFSRATPERWGWDYFVLTNIHGVSPFGQKKPDHGIAKINPGAKASQRRLLLDLQGNCFELIHNANGDEVRKQVERWHCEP